MAHLQFQEEGENILRWHFSVLPIWVIRFSLLPFRHITHVSTWEGTRLIFLALCQALPLMLNINLCSSMKSWGHVQQFHTRDSNPGIKMINRGHIYFRLNVFTFSFWHIRCTYAKKGAPHSYMKLVQQASQAPFLRMSSMWGWSSLSCPQKSRSYLPPIHLDVICLGRR